MRNELLFFVHFILKGKMSVKVDKIWILKVLLFIGVVLEYDWTKIVAALFVMFAMRSIAVGPLEIRTKVFGQKSE